MRRTIRYFFFVVLVVSCGRASDSTTTPSDPILASSNGKSLSTSNYFRYLYRDLAGTEASDAQVSHAMAQVRAGGQVSDIVRAQIESDPKLRAFTAKLGGDLDSGVTPKSPGSRGITTQDFLLYYLLLNGNSRSSSLNYALPFLLNSRQYLTYLIYSYL